MRRLVVGLLVLLVLAVAADRVGAYVAGRVVAGRLRTSAGLQADPDVTITGFPFVTQALGGRYDRIRVRAHDLDRGGVRLADLRVDLLGARIPARQALAGAVREVPVEGLRGELTVAFADLTAGRTELTVTPLANDRVLVTGRVKVLGATVQASARSSVALQGTSLLVRAESVSVQGSSSPAVDRALTGLLDLRVPIGTLPYGLRLTGVRSGPAGLVVTAASGPTVLRTSGTGRARG